MDLGRFYDLTAAKAAAEEVKTHTHAYQAAYVRAYHSLKAARQVELDAVAAVRGSFDAQRAARRVDGIIQRELRQKGGQAGKTTWRFLGSVTHRGYIWRFDSVDALCPKVYEFADSWELAGPALARLHAAAVEKGFYLLDSPVSGGETGANGGTLVIMCGGEKEVFDEVRPYLLMMGKTATYMGPSGCGSTAKVANNMMVGIHLCAMGEAFAFAKKAGLDPQTLFDAIKGGFAQSAVMDGKVPQLLSRDFSASARIAVHLKDINNAMDVAAHLGVELPMTEIVKEQMDWMDARGMIDEDQCALAKYYEDAMGVEIK